MNLRESDGAFGRKNIRFRGDRKSGMLKRGRLLCFRIIGNSEITSLIQPCAFVLLSIFTL